MPIYLHDGKSQDRPHWTMKGDRPFWIALAAIVGTQIAIVLLNYLIGV